MPNKLKLPELVVISRSELEAVVWLLDWSWEHMNGLLESTKEMERSGECLKGCADGFQHQLDILVKLKIKIKESNQLYDQRS